MTVMLRILAFLALTALASGQPNPSWKRAYPAHKVAGNIYYVGTEDLACYLITTPAGHILINTGLADSVPLLQESFRSLGFKLQDIRILLNMQAHYDHVAAMAEVQKISGAAVYATSADTPVLEDGGKSDPHLGPEYRFARLKVNRRLRDGDIVSLGGVDLKVILSPGHTMGSSSYQTTVDDNGKKRSVLFVNLPSVVMPLVGNVKYPKIATDFNSTLKKQEGLSPDIWLAGHASQYDMAVKHKAGSFVDPKGYREAVAKYRQLFEHTLAKETQAASAGRTLR
jgi:metallo-beta-lactamase class B